METDFTSRPQDDAFVRVKVGSVDLSKAFGRIRAAIDEKSAQLRGLKGEVCVVVLHNANSFVSLDEFFMRAAMFGDPVIAVPILGASGEPYTVYTDGRTVQPSKNTTVSAVTVLSRVRAHPELVDKALATPRAARGGRLPTNDEVRSTAETIWEIYESHPEAAEMVPRLTIHHNP